MVNDIWQRWARRLEVRTNQSLTSATNLFTRGAKEPHIPSNTRLCANDRFLANIQMPHYHSRIPCDGTSYESLR